MLKRKLWQKPPYSYLLGLTGVAIVTFGISYTHTDTFANASMLYLLLVTLCALFLGRMSAVISSFACFLVCDFFFVDPRYQLTVSSPSEWLALCTFLVTSTIIGQLTAMLRAQVEAATKASKQTQVLADASWLVASDVDSDRVLKKLLKQVATTMSTKEAALMLALHEEQAARWLLPEDNQTMPAFSDKAVAFVMANSQPINWQTDKHWEKALVMETHPDAIYIPLTFESERLGLLYLLLNDGASLTVDERNLITSLANHMAVVVHRDNLLRMKMKAQALSEADKLKTALLSMVSHDFRTPLTSIKASVGTLLQQETMEASVQANLLQAIDEDTDRLNKMVGNILNLSKLEAGAWRPLIEQIPITELIGGALSSFSEPEESARLKVHIAPEVNEVSVDSVQMTQVLANLIENALKYSGAEVNLNVLKREEEVVFEVCDRGMGLQSGEEEQIFLPFFRSPDLREGAIPGMGIGLAVCKGLVEAHGGHLTARNRNDGGATFSVCLPALRV